MADVPKIFPLGDSAVTVNFGNEISPALNTKAISLASYIDSNPFPGFIEAVPAYSSVAVFYDLQNIRTDFFEFRTAFEAVEKNVRRALEQSFEFDIATTQITEIPTDFGDDAALDIDVIAEYGGVSREEAIDLFTSKTYRVYMLGFLPGFTYMGEVDDRIAVPRKESPRKKVPKGSVGIAGNQTGIYPLESPGGWQIIGRTNVEIFTPQSEPPCLLKPGDQVRFVRIT